MASACDVATYESDSDVAYDLELGGMSEATSRMTWGEWFDRWDEQSERFHIAFSSGATDIVLASIVRDQQDLLTKIPRTR